MRHSKPFQKPPGGPFCKLLPVPHNSLVSRLSETVFVFLFTFVNLLFVSRDAVW